MPTDWDEPYDVKGLAAVLKKSEGYVYDMKSSGFRMPGDRATLRMAFDWLAKHGEFSRQGAAKVRFARRREEMGRNGKNDRLASP